MLRGGSHEGQRMRLDVALVERGLARSRTHAQALISTGDVSVAGEDNVPKASLGVTEATVITVNAPDGYVGRAAGKLAGALNDFPQISVTGRVCLDVGASTGGFTQVLLEHGAACVYALDVGHGQLVPSIAEDPRVHNVEGLNVRELETSRLPDPRMAEQIDLVVGDLAFISLTIVIPVLVEQVHARDYVLLVKPQFEVGRARLGRGGIVTEPSLWATALRAVIGVAIDNGLVASGIIPSQLRGGSGNQEFLVWLQPSDGHDRPEWDAMIASAVAGAQNSQKRETR